MFIPSAFLILSLNLWVQRDFIQPPKFDIRCNARWLALSDSIKGCQANIKWLVALASRCYTATEASDIVT